MARLFQQVAPGRLQVPEGGGLIALFGLPFLAAGLFAILSGLGVVPVAGAGAMPGFAWLVVRCWALSPRSWAWHWSLDEAGRPSMSPSTRLSRRGACCGLCTSRGALSTTTQQ